jgi:hypothetical protein
MSNPIRRMRRDIQRTPRTINATHQVTVEVLICPGCFAGGVVSPLRDRDTRAFSFAVLNDDCPCSKEDDLGRDRALHGNDGW